MSRIGRKLITVPPSVTVKQDGKQLRVDGPKGQLSITLPDGITVKLTNQEVSVERAEDHKAARAMHGLYRALIANMVEGTLNGFSKDMEIVGVGYRAQLQGQQLTLNVGLSHPVMIPIPEGLTIEVPKPTALTVRGADKYLVGQFAATLRSVAPPEPYKGKGIKYAGEKIRRKAGKAATGAGGKGG